MALVGCSKIRQQRVLSSIAQRTMPYKSQKNQTEVDGLGSLLLVVALRQDGRAIGD